jgi:hypothetical protein
VRNLHAARDAAAYLAEIGGRRELNGVVGFLLRWSSEVWMIRVRLSLPKNIFFALRVLRDQAACGEIRISAEGARLSILVLDGVPVHATGWETFGRWLLRTDRLTLAEYVEIAEDLATANREASDTAFGEAALRYGTLTLDVVREAFTEYVGEQLVFCVASAGESWRFVPRERSEVKVESGPVRVDRLFLRAAEILPPEQSEAALARTTTTYPRLCESTARIVHTLSLTTREARFVSSIDGTRTVEELVAVRISAESNAAALLAILLLSGLADSSTQPTPLTASILPRRDGVVHRRGSVPPTSRRKTIRPAGRWAAPKAPDAVSFPPAPRVPAGFVDVESETTVALGRVQRRIERNDYDAARDELARIATLGVANAECATYEAWIAFRTGDNLASTAARLALKRQAKLALEKNASFGFGHYVLAQLARLEGDESAVRQRSSMLEQLGDDREADDGSYRIVRGSMDVEPESAPPPSTVVRRDERSSSVDWSRCNEAGSRRAAS